MGNSINTKARASVPLYTGGTKTPAAVNKKQGQKVEDPNNLKGAAKIPQADPPQQNSVFGGTQKSSIQKPDDKGALGG